jgi:hypothetical protein
MATNSAIAELLDLGLPAGGSLDMGKRLLWREIHAPRLRVLHDPVR